MLTARGVVDATVRVDEAPLDRTSATRRPRRPVPTVMVGGFPTAAVTRGELAALMVEDCLQARRLGQSSLPKLVFSSNGQGIALAGRNKEFNRLMLQADIIHADGMPVVYASRMTATPLPDRIATTDFFHDAARAATEHGLRFFILGANESTNSKTVAAIQRMYPGVEIVGRHHGYFGEDQDEAICAAIRESGADVLWVALGKPRQEEWCVRNRQRLAGVGWIKTCGGLYAFLTGEAKRAPDWMQRFGLEWAYRALQEPRRLALRYFATNPYALTRLVAKTEWTRPIRHRLA